MKYSRPRGTQDVVPPTVYAWQLVEEGFDRTFGLFGYQPIRTPIFESTDLFLRSVGEGTDIVSKEMYTFKDRGGRSLTLRPENTASVIRAYLEKGMHRLGGVTRLCYAGPMFRYDRPQAGRYRQFHQVGAEAIGSLSPMLDVEIIDLVVTALGRLGFGGLDVEVNSVGCPVCRPGYGKILRAALEKLSGRLCEDCTQRAVANPLRVFDCKKCAGVKAELPPVSENLCGACETHFGEVKRLLEGTGHPFRENPRLVRGLDYYTRTTFEIIHTSLGAQNALCGGGRYDDLVEQCGGPPTPAVGFSAGVERIISVLPKEKAAAAQERAGVDFYVVCVDERSAARALRAATVLRRYGSVELDASLRALKKQLRSAERRGVRVSVIVDSGSPRNLMWKDMTSRRQMDVDDERLEDAAKEMFEEGSGETT